MIEMKIIDKKTYISSNLKEVFQAEYSRCFAKITDGRFDFGIGWRSDLLLPEVVILSDTKCSIGIDQNFAIIDFAIQSILLNIDTFFNYEKVIIFEGIIVVITEYELFKIDKERFQITQQIDLPEKYGNVINSNSGKLVIKLLNNTVIEITI